MAESPGGRRASAFGVPLPFSKPPSFPRAASESGSPKSPRGKTDASSQRRSSAKSSDREVRIDFVDEEGIMRRLILLMPTTRSIEWDEGLRTVMKKVGPRTGHARAAWITACVKATSKKAPFISRSELKKLLIRANIQVRDDVVGDQV